jgi:ribosomal protein S18 acetylase RimI-like enzyme
MPAVVAVRSAAYEQWNGPQTAQQQESEGQAWIRKWGSCREALLLVAVHAEQTLGYLIGGQREPGELAIGHIGVRPECCRQGIGQQLPPVSAAARP